LSEYPVSCIYLHLTEKCNLSCRHCWVYRDGEKSPGEKELDPGKLREALSSASAGGLNSVKITGGEPFLYSDLTGLASWLGKRGIRFTVETNGTLITRESARMMKDSGMEEVSVSLDGSSPEVYGALRGSGDAFYRALEGIRSAAEAGLYVKLIFSLWKGNASDIVNTVSLARDLGAALIKINPVTPVARGAGLGSKGLLLEASGILELKDRFSAGDIKGIRVLFDIPPVFLKPEEIRKGCLCGIRSSLSILPDGSVSICGIGSTAKDAAAGNIHRDPVMRIWRESHFFKNLRKNLPGRLEGICGECIMKYICLGKCRAAAYWESGSFYSPFWFCRQAYEKGIFPQKDVRGENYEIQGEREYSVENC